MAERKGSVASMVRLREAMRLEFFTWLFLKRQREMDREIRTKWSVKGLWKKLGGGKESAEKEEGRGLFKRRRFGVREMKGLVLKS
jgi:hypothetical protein